MSRLAELTAEAESLVSSISDDWERLTIPAAAKPAARERLAAVAERTRHIGPRLHRVRAIILDLVDLSISAHRDGASELAAAGSASDKLTARVADWLSIDTHAVPGSCADGKPAAAPEPPDRFASTPTAADIAARDELVAAQESLLNTYRCMFSIDTEVVPGGCPDQPANQPDDPAGAFTAISAGSTHSCGIRADHTAACWGDNSTLAENLPAGVSLAN